MAFSTTITSPLNKKQIDLFVDTTTESYRPAETTEGCPLNSSSSLSTPPRTTSYIALAAWCLCSVNYIFMAHEAERGCGGVWLTSQHVLQKSSDPQKLLFII